MIKIFLLFWFLHSSKACVGIAPNDVIGNKGEYCGERIKLTYPQGTQVTGFELLVKGDGNDCSVKERISVLSQPTLIKAKSNACILNITFASNTLTIASQVSVCIQGALGIDCSSHNIETDINIKNNIKTVRSIGEKASSRRQDGKQAQREEGALLSLGLSFILVITIGGTLLSCCYQKRKANYEPQLALDPEANGLTDSSYNSPYNDTIKSISYSTRGSTLEHSNGFYPVPSTSPISVSFCGANRQSQGSQVYISPALLNIPDVPPIMPPPRNSKVSISLENIIDLGHADTLNRFNIDHKRDQEEEGRHYAVLEEPVGIMQGREERRESNHSQKDVIDDELVETTSDEKRTYFVLDVTVPDLEQHDPGRGDEDIQPEDSLSSRIYHVLDPVSSASPDSPPLCSVCHNPINENEDESLYLVILPDGEKSVSASLEQSQDASSTTDDPIYQVLEQPSLICQSCLCSEDEPIYHELEKPDPIYDRVRNIMRQGTSINSDGSSQHLYSTVHSLDINEDPNSSSLDPISSKKRVYLRDIKNAVSSGDYASIPNDVHPPDSQRSSSGAKNQERTTRKAKGLSSLQRSLSQTHYTPFIIAQRKKSGSYHVLNVDEIWNHQQANRYAPVSIVMRKQSQPRGFTRKGASMKSRKSYIRDQLIEGPSYNSTYEVPVPCRATPTPPKPDTAASTESKAMPASVTVGQAIPPPALLSKRLSRQDALVISAEGKERKLFTVRSEPCLSSNSDDYDHLDVLSQASSSPLPPPFSPLPSCASPSKNPFKRTFSSPSYSPLRRKSTDTKSFPLKTHLLSESEEDDEEEV
ncbi:PREDICTED: uncharacterized protein LOC109581050 [Amphimedon queenslandica]|uniref:CUB domain-containing protein n=1 Tax=Amphimedon queenslandica TaxID=400682 RepID=A0A1X7V854_AMPQE|nr:PREDICTED: uncharacterized protein LOC109581050 [Amphimedon queenslandica]|eukprot:XP_019850358.1 PREDICTED: uncharacterized protein LOC109581050 [Amphimedon queenslandica]